MTTITLTTAQINQVLADHCEDDPPTDPPPVDPPVPDPPDPPPTDEEQPIPPNADGYHFEQIWAVKLDEDRRTYGYQKISATNATWLSIAMLLPTMTREYDFKMGRAEVTGTTGIMKAFLSWNRDPDLPWESEITWGLGGRIALRVTPEDSGKWLYYNMRMDDSRLNWGTDLIASLNPV